MNAISAGPVNTVEQPGASPVFTSMLKLHTGAAPAAAQRGFRLEVGQAALYLPSDLGSAVTGEVLHVDAGYHTMGM